MAEQRKLAAILAADVVGFSRLTGFDEDRTLARLRALRSDLIDPTIAVHNGRVVKRTGDGALVEFRSVVDAVRCAIEVQNAMVERNAGVPPERRIEFRVGIHLGDVVEESDGDLMGDGVNIASRLEGLATPGAICLSEDAYRQVKARLDLAVSDLGETRLKNINDPMRVYSLQVGVAASAKPAPQTDSIAPNATPGIPDKPSIAVLPFVNMSGDPEQEYFSDGLTEDIIGALSRISNFLVIARTSTFTYKGKPADVKRVAKELGVRYVMEGSVRRAGDRLRVTAQLIDAETGHHVWAERYDRPLTELFDIQDEITRSVAASTQTQIDLAEGLAAQSRSTTDFKARGMVAKAWARIYDQTPEALMEASDLVEEAIRSDPTLPRAHQARVLILLHRMAFGEIPSDPARALELAETALRLAPRDEWSHWLMGEAHGFAGQLEDAVAECELALEINPNCSIILDHYGGYLAYIGRPQEAIEACRLALRLSPRDPANFWRHYHIALAHFVAADYTASLNESKRVARSRPLLRGGIIWAASAAALDKADEARVAVTYCLAQRPDLRVSNVVPDFIVRFSRDEDHERLLALLRKAGLPE